MKLIDVKIKHVIESTEKDEFGCYIPEGLYVTLTCQIPEDFNAGSASVSWEQTIKTDPGNPYALCEALKLAGEALEDDIKYMHQTLSLAVPD